MPQRKYVEFLAENRRWGKAITMKWKKGLPALAMYQVVLLFALMTKRAGGCGGEFYTHFL